MTTESTRTGAWSEPATGLRGRLIVGSEGVFVGTPEARVDLELQHVSEVANPLWVFWDVDEVLSFALHDVSGNEVPTAIVPSSILRVHPFWLALPFDSTLRMNITTRGYGRRPSQAMFIGLPNAVWEIGPGDERRFFLSGRLSVAETEQPGLRAWSGVLALPAVEVVVTGEKASATR